MLGDAGDEVGSCVGDAGDEVGMISWIDMSWNEQEMHAGVDGMLIFRSFEAGSGGAKK